MAIFVAVLVGLLAAAFVSVLYACYRPRGFDRIEHLKGPPLAPLIGLIPLVYHLDTVGLTECMIDWIRRYGSPIRLKGLWHIGVSISKTENVERILKSTTNITKGRAYNFLHRWMGDGLLTSTGAKWHRQRRLLTPAFHFEILRQYVPVFNEHGRQLADWFGRRCDTGGGGGGQLIDVRGPITLAALDMICETSMGRQLRALESGSSAYADAIIGFGDSLVHRYTKPWLSNDFLYYNFNPTGRSAARAIELMKRFTNEVIDEKEAELRAKSAAAVGENAGSQQANAEGEPSKNSLGVYKKHRRSFIDLLLQLKKDGDMSREEVREQVDTFMFEGHDTTATGIIWILYCIAREPEHQKILQAEIDSAIAANGDGPSMEVTPEQLNEMGHLDRCIKEGQRLFPSVPAILRRVTEEMKIDEQTTLPKDCMIEIYFYMLHRDANVFPDPERFDPDRWLPENVAKRSPYSYAPFSAGLRNCIGQKFAMLEMKIVLCHVLRHFTLECTQTVDDIQPIMAMVLRPTNAVDIRFTPRYTVTEL